MSETAEAYHNLNEILDHINDAYAPNTIRAYRADFSGWISFCTTSLRMNGVHIALTS